MNNSALHIKYLKQEHQQSTLRYKIKFISIFLHL